jgi:hypothetical protein
VDFICEGQAEGNAPTHNDKALATWSREQPEIERALLLVTAERQETKRSN